VGDERGRFHAFVVFLGGEDDSSILGLFTLYDYCFIPIHDRDEFLLTLCPHFAYPNTPIRTFSPACCVYTSSPYFQLSRCDCFISITHIFVLAEICGSGDLRQHRRARRRIGPQSLLVDLQVKRRYRIIDPKLGHPSRASASSHSESGSKVELISGPSASITDG